MNRTRLAAAVSLAVLAILAVVITVVTFDTLITPEFRNRTFHHVVTTCCLAELVFFGYLAFLFWAGSRGSDPAHAVRLRTMTLITLWALAIIVSGAFAVAPSYTDTFYSDKILIWQLLVTFLVLAAAIVLHQQQAAVEAGSAGPQQERAQVQSYALGLDPLLSLVTALSQKRPAQAVTLDHLRKRLETLRHQLSASFPRTDRVAGRLVEPVSLQALEQELRALHDRIEGFAEVPEAQLEAETGKARELIDRAIVAVQHRQKALSF